MDCPGDDFLSLLWSQAIEAYSIATHTNRQIWILVRVFVSILQDIAAQHIDIQMMRIVAKVTIKKSGKVGLLVGWFLAKSTWQ
mmetsp:Transcript_71337/g.206515  ORF Transcript_71337/g.206515 Transcript_71337/m.206515 type:complete len:83 (+) Transcript_71337:180-428(+)